jgi:transketolase
MEEMRDTFGKYLVELGYQYDNMYVLDADLKTSTKTDYFEDVFPRRFLQCGIAEQNMIGISAGLALEGKIPVVSTFAAFLSQRALDQVNSSIAYPFLNVKLAGAYSGLFASMCGATHQSLADIAIMRAIPNMRVADPASNEELKLVMKASMDYFGPVYYRVSRGALQTPIPEIESFNWGKGVILHQGNDITIVSSGVTTQWAYSATLALREIGIEVQLLHMPSIKPFDEELLIQAARKTKFVMSVENHSIKGGLGSLVSEILGEKCPTRIVRLGVQDCYSETASDSVLADYHGISEKGIFTCVKEHLQSIKD